MWGGRCKWEAWAGGVGGRRGRKAWVGGVGGRCGWEARVGVGECEGGHEGDKGPLARD